MTEAPELTDMSADRQFSLSHVYLPRPIILIPVPSGTFHIFSAYGQERKFLAEVLPEDLVPWLTGEFLSSQASHARPRPALDLDLSSIIEGISL